MQSLTYLCYILFRQVNFVRYLFECQNFATEYSFSLIFCLSTITFKLLERTNADYSQAFFAHRSVSSNSSIVWGILLILRASGGQCKLFTNTQHFVLPVPRGVEMLTLSQELQAPRRRWHPRHPSPFSSGYSPHPHRSVFQLQSLTTCVQQVRKCCFRDSGRLSGIFLQK